MNDIPTQITNSKLWERLNQHSDFHAAIKGLRDNSSAVAAKIGEVIPDYTDHSVIHMDALWAVTDHVFTANELQIFSPGEAFILACSFYIHDIGMGIAATKEGVAQLEQSNVYKSTYERLMHSRSYDSKDAKVIALRIAARELHAEKAESFIDDVIPGLDRYLLESKDLRDKWGAYIGQIAASHHWTLQDVNRKLGIRGKIPDPIGGDVDLGFLACALRVIDYAHINAARASSLDRILRSNIGAESLKHWNAQEHITGPRREEDLLIFGATRPIDVDGWWTFYEMASGLDREITSVAEYLAERTVSSNRFSLEGVKGVRTPQSFASYVPTDGFEPVDVRFRPDSIERLIGILGGRTLYGDDFFAPMRELLQNASDAIQLQQAFAKLMDYPTEPGEIRIAIEFSDEGGVLSITDNGVGMSANIITNYLLGIASDYWNSPDFFSEYSGTLTSGFKPVGRFGIGFLSVFMIGDEIEIQTQKRGGNNLKLKIKGLGRRGMLITQPQGLRAGTTIRIKIEREPISNYNNIDKVVRAKAPMLSIPIKISQQGAMTIVAPKWWQRCSQEELIDFVANQRMISTTPNRVTVPASDREHSSRHYRMRGWREEYRGWTEQYPEALSESFRILASPGIGGVLVCSRGFVVDTESESFEGMVGLIEIGDAELTADRSIALDWNSDDFEEKIRAELRPHIVNALDRLSKAYSIPAIYGFLVAIGNLYGADLLVDTNLPWITLVESPGDCRLHSPSALRERLTRSKEKEIVIVYGDKGTPWECAQFSKRFFPETTNRAIIMPVSEANQPPLEYDYTEQSEPEQGELQQLYGDYVDAHLLTSVLNIVGQSLNKTEDDLVKMQWIKMEDTIALRIVQT